MRPDTWSLHHDSWCTMNGAPGTIKHQASSIERPPSSFKYEASSISHQSPTINPNSSVKIVANLNRSGIFVVSSKRGSAIKRPVGVATGRPVTWSVCLHNALHWSGCLHNAGRPASRYHWIKPENLVSECYVVRTNLPGQYLLVENYSVLTGIRTTPVGCRGGHRYVEGGLLTFG